MRKTRLIVVGVLLAASSAGFAATKFRHPNLAAAYKECQTAQKFIVKAQEANDLDMAGHAQKAKTLLEQAEQELKLAAEEATENAPKKK